jgi:DNA-binding NarL/FixJ family response regulator
VGLAVRDERPVGVRVAPRFVLAEPVGSHIGATLAGIGWHALATATELRAVDERTLADADVLVVCCSERTLLSPAFHAEMERVGTSVRRLAIVSESGPDAAAYAARLGWHGFLPCEAPFGVIARAMVAVSRGELSFPASTTRALARALALVAPLNGVAGSALTPRQRQIVSLLAHGATDAEIAVTLSISRSTAHKHVQNARRRLNAKTRSQLVAASRQVIEPARPTADGTGEGPA